MRGEYFPATPGSPTPLAAEVGRRVRFEEVDALGIVWHGRYPSYLEDARGAFGERYGLGYLDFYRHGVVAPIKQLHLDYHRPLRIGEEVTVTARLHWCDAARLNFDYVIRDAHRRVTTTGYSVQMLLDTDHSLLVVHPPFLEAFRDRWHSGELP